MTNELLRYHRQVKKELVCPRSMRDKFLADARRMTDDFISENPGATMAELKNAVGDPSQLAAMFLENADSNIVKGYRKRKSRLKRLAIILLVVALLAMTALAIYVINFKNAEFTKESTIIIYETREE